MDILNRLRYKLSPPQPQPPPEEMAACDRMLALVNLQACDIAIDCGANVGNITARIAATQAEVFTFEPNPYAFSVLKKRFEKNQNVHCFNQGVHDHNGTMRLYLHENADQNQIYWSTGSSFLEYKGNVRKESSVEVDVIDLVEFVANLKREIKLIKMDVEGVECPIIQKMINTGIIHRIEMLLVETHDAKVPQLKKETDALRNRIAKEGLTNINLNWI